MNWQGLMALGLGTLRLSPAQFWSMTPRELAAATGLASAPAPMDATTLEALTARYPDVTHDPR